MHAARAGLFPDPFPNAGRSHAPPGAPPFPEGRGVGGQVCTMATRAHSTKRVRKEEYGPHLFIFIRKGCVLFVVFVPILIWL